MSDPTLFSRSAEPLAARMRPKTLEQFLGQEHLLGPGKALGELIRRGDVGSCIFWGPPGSGKTTLARLIANHTDRHFEPFSAVTEGVARVREIIKEAEDRLKYEGRGTILFCDEIHRFNRSQQDAFLPWVENGIVNLISASHKAVRGSDVEGSLYWLARMLAGGEDPLYIARRLVRIASEDVGLADPRALSVALGAKDAYHFLGSPEGELALAEAAIYLATAPKSNSAYTAFGEAMTAAEEHPAEPVPLHIRQAPTPLMKELGYGAGYKYAFDSENAYLPQEYLPEALRGRQWYQPSEFGYEKTVKERMDWWAKLKREATER